MNNRLAYATVLAASLFSLAWQPAPAEAPAHTQALLSLASWAGDDAAGAAAIPLAQQSLPTLSKTGDSGR